ncbi:MAG: NAD-dependent epimerase/dehydratase family protein [Bacteroidales bacterium]|nr:NAD-dependent epimerase/dehydratase family protein [Bacteroidales bacterium]
MNILITGIHSLLGSCLVDVFKEKNVVYGLDFDATEKNGVRKVFTNNELKDIPDVDVVIHIDGIHWDPHDLSEALAYSERNAGFTKKIYNWFTQSTAKYFIYLSSIKAAGTSPDAHCALTEVLSQKPFGVYGESKFLAERYILEKWTYGKKIYILRPAIIHGLATLGSKHLDLLFDRVKKGRPYLLGKFVCRRSFTTIDNLCFVLKRILEMDIPGGVYNVVDDESLQLVEIYEMMAHALHKKARVYEVSKWIIRSIASVGTRFNFGLDGFQYQKLSTDFEVSNEKLKKALGIKRMPVSVVDGFNRSVINFANKNN